MAKWLNKYFSLGNSKTKSPPQPPRPDYREQRRRGERREQPPQAVPQACSASSASCGSAAACFSASSGSLPDDSGSTSDLIRAYRAQKERDFEDPYNGPGSSLRKLRAMCRLDYCGGGGDPGGGQRAFTAAAGAAGCCCAAAGAGAAASSSSSSGSPHLYRSSSERRPATPAEVRYISPKHRLIKVESAGAAGDPPGGVCSGGRTWSPTTCGGKKLLNKCAAEETGAGQKDKVRSKATGAHGKLRHRHVSHPFHQLCSGILGSRLQRSFCQMVNQTLSLWFLLPKRTLTDPRARARAPRLILPRRQTQPALPAPLVKSAAAGLKEHLLLFTPGFQ